MSSQAIHRAEPAISSGRTPFERRRRLYSTIAILAFAGLIVCRQPIVDSAYRESLEVAGQTMLILAAFGRIWSGLYLHGRKSKVLCRSGPYSMTRNPLYFFSFLGAVGVALTLESLTLSVLVALAFVLYYRAVINDEEQRLGGLFGDQFDRYRQQVPQFFPRFSGLKEWDADASIEVRPHRFARAIVEASLFVWLILVIEACEPLLHQEMFGGAIALIALP
jgi:protein-S-isoprenylcysteine O-methyltransferase Ste14